MRLLDYLQSQTTPSSSTTIRLEQGKVQAMRLIANLQLDLRESRLKCQPVLSMGFLTPLP